MAERKDVPTEEEFPSKLRDWRARHFTQAGFATQLSDTTGGHEPSLSTIKSWEARTKPKLPSRIYLDAIATLGGPRPKGDLRKPVGRPPRGSSALLAAAKAMYERGELAGAIASSRRAVDRAQDDPKETAAALKDLGFYLYRKGELTEAARLFELGVDASRRARDRVSEAEMLFWQGTLDWHANRLDEAEGRCAAGDKLLGRGGASGRVRALLIALRGHIAVDRGADAAGARLLGKAIRLARRVGDRVTAARCLRYRGLNSKRQGRFAEAEKDYHDALELFDAEKDRSQKARTLEYLGYLYLAQGKFDRAEKAFVEDRRVHRAMGTRSSVGVATRDIAFVQFAAGRYAESLKTYQEALVELKAAEATPDDIGWALLGMARCYASLGKAKQSERYARQAEAVAKGRTRGLALVQVAQARHLQGDLVDALAVIRAATHELAARQSELGMARLVEGVILLEGSDREGAVASLQEAHRLLGPSIARAQAATLLDLAKHDIADSSVHIGRGLLLRAI